MKRSNTQAKNMAVNTRLKGLALITGMVLLFSSGISIAAPADFKLWQKPLGSEKLVELTHVNEDESSKAVKWLATEPSAENTIKFVTAFAAEPFKFAEGLKAALVSVKDEAAQTKLKTDIKKSLEEVAPLVFGSGKRKLALMDLVTKIMDTKDLDKKEALLKELFDEIAREELGLKTKGEEVAVVEPTKAPSAEPTKASEVASGAGKTLEDLVAQIKKEWAEMVKGAQTPAAEPTQKPIVEVGQNPNTTSTANQTSGPTQQQQQTATGEKNNANLEKMVNQVCDQVGALQTAAQAQFAALNKTAADAIDGLNNLFNQEAIRQRFNGQQQKKNGLDDALPGLIASALGDNNKNNQGITPPQQIQQPQQAQQQNRDRDNQQPLPLPSPEQQQPQQPQVAPMMSLPVLADNTPIRVSTGRLPISNGIQELDRAESIAASLENREPYTKQIAMIPPQSLTSALLITPISKLDADINRVASAKRVAEEKAKSMDRQLERLKDGGRAALSDSDKRREKQYAAEFEEKKQAFEQEKQMIQQQSQQIAQGGGDAASYSQQANQYLTTKMQEVQQAKRRKEQFDAELESKVESLNGEIKSLAGQRDDLKSAAADLEGKLASLKSEQGQLAQMYTTALQREMSGINGQQQQQPNNPVGQRLMNFGGSTGGRQTPSRLPNNQSGAPVPYRGAANPGDAMRGSLSSKTSL